MSTYEFTYPYMLVGLTMAEFDARCEFTVSGHKDDRQVCEFDAIEIFARGPGLDAASLWVAAEEPLTNLIIDWLWKTITDHEPRLLEIAAEDAAGDAIDHAHARHEDRLMDGPPEGEKA